MADPRRDGVLALVALVAIVVGGVRIAGTAPFLHLRAAVTGVGAAVALEWLFLARPSLAEGWERRGVPLLAAVGVVAVALVVASRIPWLLGAAAWGLLAYLCLLGWVVRGRRNPVAWLVPSERD